VHSAAADVDVASGASVARDVILACEGARVGGSVGRDLRAIGDVFRVSGEVTRAVKVSGHELHLAPTARIGGDVIAKVESATSFTRDAGAKLAREPQITVAPARGEHGSSCGRNQWLTFGFYFGQLMRIAAALALGLVLYWLLPALFQWATPPERQLLRSGGIGFLALVATPVAAILLCITVIGLPIGVLAFLMWIVTLYLSGIFVALMVGQLLLRSPQSNGASFALALLIGLALVRVAVNLPYLGGVLCFLVVIVGLGMLVAQLVQLARRLRTPVLA
jgi:hypothetical protein